MLPTCLGKSRCTLEVLGYLCIVTACRREAIYVVFIGFYSYKWLIIRKQD